MIDLHCHILPGVDDGAETLEDSIAMAKVAIEQGITHVMCTPHHQNGVYLNPASKVIPLVAKLQKELDDRGLDLTVLEGQEVRIFGELLESIEKNEIIFTDLDNTYVLIEFPTALVPNFAEDVLFSLRSFGYVPVIVHPERNSAIRKDPNLLLPFLEMGVLTQLTAPSVVGKFGKSIQKTSFQLLDHNMVHMVASDAHGINKRNFYLKEAYETIASKYGQERVAAMQQVAKDLVNGDPVTVPDFKEIKKGFWHL